MRKQFARILFNVISYYLRRVPPNQNTYQVFADKIIFSYNGYVFISVLPNAEATIYILGSGKP